MDYNELLQLCVGKSFPIAGKNEHGENVIIAHRCQHWICGDIKIDEEAKVFSLGGYEFHEGDFISLDGTTGYQD